MTNDIKSLMDMYKNIIDNDPNNEFSFQMPDTSNWGDSVTETVTRVHNEIDRRKLGELYYDSKTDELYVMIENNADGSPDKVVIKDIVDFKKLITLKLLREK